VETTEQPARRLQPVQSHSRLVARQQALESGQVSEVFDDRQLVASVCGNQLRGDAVVDAGQELERRTFIEEPL
jgi:hypothetical protein